MTLDRLTNELIRTLDNFDRLGMNTEAREYWQNSYQEVRLKRETIKIHCVDCFAYDVANRKLEQYYNSINTKRTD